MFGSKALSVMMAAVIPTEVLLERLEEEILNYKINPSKEKFDNIAAACSAILLKHMTDGTPEGAAKIIDRLQEVEQRDKIFNTPVN